MRLAMSFSVSHELEVTCDAPLAATARRGGAASAARQSRGLCRSGGDDQLETSRSRYGGAP